MPNRLPHQPLCSPHPSGGDGASDAHDPHVLLAQHQRKVRALTEDETGLRFESLALFAEPLFELYDLDPNEAFTLKHAPETADETAVVVLEAARMLWAFFSLDERERDRHEEALAAFLLGPEHAPEDHAELETLLDRMSEQWEMLTPEDRRTAESAAAPTLGLRELLVHPAFAHPGDVPNRAYGPAQLPEVEARALFAQPLLDDIDDLERMEAAMERASAYWSLAHQPSEHREALLAELVQSLALNPSERQAVEQEARRMLARFDQLFPEHRA